MASREPVTIDFGGGQMFEIRPLTIAQVEGVERALTRSGSPVELARRCIAVALSRNHKEVIVEDIETDSPTLATIFVAILRLGGFVPTAGEAGAAAPNAHASGETSADGSSLPPAPPSTPSTTSSSGVPSS